MALRRALCFCSLLLLPPLAGAAGAVVIIAPPPPEHTIAAGADAEVSSYGDLRVELFGAGLSVTSLDVLAAGSITIGPGVSLVASETLSFCAGGEILAAGQLVAGTALSLDAGGACAIGDLFALDPVARFLGPTAGTVTLRATGDITIVPEPAAGALIAVTGTVALGVRRHGRLRRPGARPPPRAP